MVTLITPQQIKQCLIYASSANINLFFDPINEVFSMYDIDTPLRMAMFIAQIGVESGSLVYTKEIASGAEYEGRRDLGNTQTGDGVLFKGRGLIQITGRANYAACANGTGIDCLNHPELLEQPEDATLSAGWFWNTHNLNQYADVGDVLGCTKRINGGTNGLATRQQIYATALRVLQAGT